jgi:hypothetical protein
MSVGSNQGNLEPAYGNHHALIRHNVKRGSIHMDPILSAGPFRALNHRQHSVTARVCGYNSLHVAGAAVKGPYLVGLKILSFNGQWAGKCPDLLVVLDTMGGYITAVRGGESKDY